MIFREQIKQIFAREYHPNVPKSWKKWKYSGLDEEHVKGIEKTVLALLDNYKVISKEKWQEIVEHIKNRPKWKGKLMQDYVGETEEWFEVLEAKVAELKETK